MFREENDLFFVVFIVDLNFYKQRFKIFIKLKILRIVLLFLAIASVNSTDLLTIDIKFLVKLKENLDYVQYGYHIVIQNDLNIFGDVFFQILPRSYFNLLKFSFHDIHQKVKLKFRIYRLKSF